ncbi:MAG TPA: glycoside hydrolase [Acidisarcina sp.]
MNEANGLELWGGIECTVNRVADTYFDQMERCGHYQRSGDLELLRGLGLTRLRYGLHWERFCAAGTLEIFAERLGEMQDLGMEPIAGLVHHGSGPPDTSLLDPDFGKKLAGYALALARRYPWIQSYTPVNEPHTTARFSGLYAHWYPHHRNFRSYVRALVNQLRGSVLSMRAVRTVRSDALFVHTEDGGKTWSTPELAELCEQREHRRWLGTDLLCGLVDERHPLFGFLRRHGLTEAEILWFAENPCRPDIVGLNYYVTSDRFLDHRTSRYPRFLAGGDTGREPLVDIEAVRLRRGGIAGAGAILTEAWRRYRIPVAITEAHLGGPPAEQVKWLSGIWNEARETREVGVDCRAVAAWAVFGSYDWCSLVTRNEGVYEPGVFKVRRGAPIPTALAGLVRGLAQGQVVQSEGGWWTRPDRFTFEPVSEDGEDGDGDLDEIFGSGRRCA